MGTDLPEKRWGHACVAAYNKMFIIGGYQGNANSLTQIGRRTAAELYARTH
jgi:hypothetical protein